MPSVVSNICDATHSNLSFNKNIWETSQDTDKSFLSGEIVGNMGGGTAQAHLDTQRGIQSFSQQPFEKVQEGWTMISQGWGLLWSRLRSVPLSQHTQG